MSFSSVLSLTPKLPNTMQLSLQHLIRTEHSNQVTMSSVCPLSSHQACSCLCETLWHMWCDLRLCRGLWVRIPEKPAGFNTAGCRKTSLYCWNTTFDMLCIGMYSMFVWHIICIVRQKDISVHPVFLVSALNTEHVLFCNSFGFVSTGDKNTSI